MVQATRGAGAPVTTHASRKLDDRRGLPAGTIVLTADGALPVEFLTPGDRIVTRAGMRVLRDVDTPGPLCFALDFDRPEVIYADGRQVCSDSGRACDV